MFHETTLLKTTQEKMRIIREVLAIKIEQAKNAKELSGYCQREFDLAAAI